MNETKSKSWDCIMIVSEDKMDQLPKKILYIVSTLENRGPTKQLFGLINNLDKNKFQPQILTLSPEPKDSRKDIFIEEGIQVNSLSLSRIQGVFFGLKKLKKMVKEISPHIIHSQGIRADTLALKLSKKFKCNFCSTIRNYAYDDYPMLYGKPLGLFFAMHHMNIIKKSSNPIACSKAIADIILENTRNCLDYIQNGIDSRLYSPVLELTEKLHLKRKLGIDISKRTFIVSGSLIQRKDPLIPLKAFIKVTSKNNAHLIVIGDGDMKAECEALANKNISIIGRVTNVVDYLRASDVYISASKSEGLPNSVLEALGVGLPVILSDIAPHMEILEKSPDIGTSFQLGDVDELAEIINEYITKDVKSQSIKAREILLKYFSAEIMSKKYQDKYDNILKS